MPQQATFA